MLELVDPFEHRQRLTLPKLILNASGDQFFLPDSWQFYWHELEGEKHLRYVPNSEHSMAGTDVTDTVFSFFHHIVTDTARPEVDWSVDAKAFQISLDEARLPRTVTLWSASNAKSRDFRVDTIRRTWQATDLTKPGRSEYRVRIKKPGDGFTAYFVELEFEGANERPLKLSTGIKVLPETLPFEPFVADSMGIASP